MSLAETRLLARRCPACRRREPGLRLSRQNVGRPVPTLPAGKPMARGSVSSGGNREGLSTVAGLAFGPAHSSAEASVIEGERRGRTIRGKFVRATSKSGRDRVSEPKSKDKPFSISKHLVWEAYRRVKANKGAPGVDGCSIRGLRSRSEEQPVSDLEPDVFGELLSAPGEGGGDTETAWRGESSGCADCGGQNRPNGGGHGIGKAGGADVPSGFLWLPAGPFCAGCGRDMPAALLGV